MCSLQKLISIEKVSVDIQIIRSKFWKHVLFPNLPNMSCFIFEDYVMNSYVLQSEEWLSRQHRVELVRHVKLCMR